MAKKFLRRQSGMISKLGKGRKRKQKWSKPKGRDNKMRLKRKGRPGVVSIGHRTPKDSRGKIDGKEIIKVKNLNDAKKVNKGDYVLVSKVGKRLREKIFKEVEGKSGKIINKTKKKNESKK